MLDYFCIFSKGGLLLWALQQFPVKGNPINSLIQHCLLEERMGESSFTHRDEGVSYTLKWTMSNRLGLVFVAVYQHALSLLYVDELLERIKKDFEPRYDPNRVAYDYEVRFRAVLEECERAAERARGLQQSKAVGGAAAERGPGPVVGAGGGADGGQGKKGGGSSEGEGEGEEEEGAAEEGKDAADEGGFNLSRLRSKAKSRRGPGGSQGGDAGAAGGSRRELSAGGGSKKLAPSESKKGSRKEKEARNWAGGEKEGRLDFSSGAAAGGVAGSDILDVRRAGASKMEVEEEEESSDDDVSPAPLSSSKPSAPPKGLLSSVVQRLAMNVVGKGALEAADLEPVLEEFRRKLMERNVAVDIASRICESVNASLEGQPLASFTRVSQMVKRAVEGALVRILTPKRSIDVLAEIRAAKSRGQPYSITFVGVNGVGKSTNLAKVAYWLLQQGVSVMIAACDTFRAGAVEQLRTHCHRLQVPLFERGYEKDPARVAQDAILHARKNRIDVVLVDTAGRMQDNEPLMRALANLIHVNKPDLVLFVGEALVGNDGVDQLSKFSERLGDLGPSRGMGRSPIDGILLTKFDTIDDKVGAALSMVYESGCPIMFVGCGQTYVDLERLNVKRVVQALLA